MAESPLIARNRLRYKPPSFQSTASHELHYDLIHDSLNDAVLDLRHAPYPGHWPHLILGWFQTWMLMILAYLQELAAETKNKDPESQTSEISRSPSVIVIAEEDFPDFLPTQEENQGQRHEPISFTSVFQDFLKSPDTAKSSLAASNIQYGASLSISQNSSYKPNPTIQRPASRHPDITATELLDLEMPTQLDDYDRVVSKFYTPFNVKPVKRYTLTDAILATLASTDAFKNFRQERQSIQKLVGEERQALQSRVEPLNKEQLAQVHRYWGAKLMTAQVISAYQIDITVKDLKTLADSCWLNDNVIDFYLNMVADFNPGTYCWTTHFFSTLKSKGYPGVARWAKRRKVNLPQMKMIIVPINIMSTHWAVAVIDNNAKTIGYYDSLSSNGNIKAVELLDLYMEKECERLLVPFTSYLLLPNIKTPQQQNGYDCGVFTCTVARYVAEHQPLAFSQKDMSTFRRRMAYEIVNKSLMHNGAPKAHL